jgi:hypothetical protein
MQSRSWKKFFSSRLIRFFSSVLSLYPFYGIRARSRYSLLEIGFPSPSTSYNTKSLTIQLNTGKY